MTVILSESRLSISAAVLSPLFSGVGIQSPVRIRAGDRERNRAAWQDLVNNTLIEWGRDPDQFDEEGIQPPAKETIRRAIRFAGLLDKADLTVPTRIVPDVRGGIVFEYPGNDAFVSFHIQLGRDIELRIFKNHQLIGRETIIEDD